LPGRPTLPRRLRCQALAVQWINDSKPAQPITRTTAMRCHHEHLDVRIQFAVQDVEGKSRYSIPANGRGKFNSKPIGMLAYLDHRGVERCKVPRAQPGSLFLIVGNVLKMFDACRSAEEVAHLSKACASRRTSPAGMRLVRPRSISSARRAASCNHSCATSSSDRASRLASSCSASSALSRVVRERASRRIVSAFMDEIVALLQADFKVRGSRPGSG